jgi:hypothetical protein
MVALLISVPLYPFFIRSMEAAAERNSAARADPGAVASASPASVETVTR